jgi:hypothetical protein
MKSTAAESVTPPSGPPRTDRFGWWVAILSGIMTGVLIGSGSSGFFHWDRSGTIIAGVIVALLTSLPASTQIIMKTLIASVMVTASCMATITLRHWSTGHWAVGHVDGKWPFIAAVMMGYVFVSGLVVALMIRAAQTRRKKHGQKRTH